jgi:hypothetical protein
MLTAEQEIANLIRAECQSWREPDLPQAFRPAGQCSRSPIASRRVAAGFAVLGAVAVVSLSSGSLDPRVWWQATQHAAQSVMQQTGLSPQPRPMPAGTEPRRAVIGGEGGGSSTPGAGGGGQGDSFGTNQRASTPGGPVNASVATGSGANGQAPPGIKVGPNSPANGGGLAGSIGEGPVNMGGSISGGGAAGCMAISGVTQLCGSTGGAPPAPPGVWPASH